MRKYIAADKNILNGKFVVKGTRMPVAWIVYLLKEGLSIKGIHKEYPHISSERIEGVVGEVIEILDNKVYASKIFK
ncbi:DUF433 domain-containing protein [Candidatus Microgenomates bacterium]|nr:MAG: DUF433 domain-containing protein [Candidatus Microgenomates bacterium]